VLAPPDPLEALCCACGSNSPSYLHDANCPFYGPKDALCSLVFKGRECSYAGPATACDKRLSTCCLLGNSANFRGVPGPEFEPAPPGAWRE
jgi:hypothetical protein